MNLSRDYFDKTIEEAKTAITQYSKVYYFIRLIRPRRITKFLFVGNHPPTNKKMLFVGNRPRRIKSFIVGITTILLVLYT